MKTARIPILLSFYAISNGKSTLVGGQITFTHLNDLSFRDYNRRKTFKTLFALYRTKPFADQQVHLVFSAGNVTTATDAYGSFYFKSDEINANAFLLKATLQTGEEVKIIDHLYSKQVSEVASRSIVVTDIDDTLLHSYITRKFLKFKTLMFTSVEKRKSVEPMQELLRKFTSQGVACFYLSNSEQNLYPLIYRFLQHNQFPQGPIFLKKMRSLWHVIRNIKLPLLNTHKQLSLEEIFSFFADRKFVLMGDNTQHDLPIYLTAAEKFQSRISHIMIRKVTEKKSDEELLRKHADLLKASGIKLYYAEHFPFDFTA